MSGRQNTVDGYEGVHKKARRSHSPQNLPSTQHIPSPTPQGTLANEPNPADYIKIVETFKGQHRTGPLIQSRFNFKITRPLPPGQSGLLLFDVILNYAFNQIVATIPSNSRTQVFLKNDSLHKQYISTRRTQPHNLRLKDLTDKLIAAIHSDDSVSLEDTSIIVSTIVDPMANVSPKVGVSPYP